MVEFGHKFRDEHFTLLEPGVLSVNHGSFGLSPTVVFDEYVKHIKNEFSFADRFMLIDIKEEYLEAAKLVSERYFKVDYHDIAFVTNSTTGVNAALTSIDFSAGDKVLFFSTIYEACHNVIKFLERTIGIVPVVIDLDEYPWEDEDILNKFSQAVSTHKPKLALYDAITLTPGVRLPFEELTRICKENDVISVVDGAHSIGQIELDLSKVQPDFFVTNLHKWLYVPRGCAALYVAPKYHAKIHTIPISNSYKDEDAVDASNDLALFNKFFFVGTASYAPVASIKAAIKFRDEVCGGEGEISKYCSNLTKSAMDLIIKKWPMAKTINNSNSLILVPGMINFSLPFEELLQHCGLNKGGDKIDFNDKAILGEIHDYIDQLLLTEYRSRIPFYFTKKGDLWMRISCQVYNEVSDYDFAIDSFIKALTRYFESKINEDISNLSVK